MEWCFTQGKTLLYFACTWQIRCNTERETGSTQEVGNDRNMIKNNLISLQQYDSITFWLITAASTIKWHQQIYDETAIDEKKLIHIL